MSCVTRLRSVNIVSPAHLTKPERWSQPEGSVYKGMAYCAVHHATIFNSRSQCQDAEILIFMRVYYEKLHDVLKLFVLKETTS